MVTLENTLEEISIEKFRNGEELPEGLKRVLDESGDPYWVESLLREFQRKFFNGDLGAYYSFAKIISPKINFSLYINEQLKRIKKAISLKEWKIGRSLTNEEEINEIEKNHISQDFRLYFMLEHPESIVLDPFYFKDPKYFERIVWLLSVAEKIDPEQKPYMNIIK